MRNSIAENLAVVMTILMLLYNSVLDIRTHRIPVKINIAAGMAGGSLQILLGLLSLKEVAAGILLGGIVYAVAVITEEAVGKGDGILLFATGGLLGGTGNLQLFLLALFLSGSWSLLLLILKKAGRKTELPFAPFLLLSYTVMLSGIII